MKRRKESPAVTPQYMAAWAKLFARSPAEIEAERQARMPAPAPRTPNAQQGPLQAQQRTQTDGVLPVPHLPKRKQP